MSAWRGLTHGSGCRLGCSDVACMSASVLCRPATYVPLSSTIHLWAAAGGEAPRHAPKRPAPEVDGVHQNR